MPRLTHSTPKYRQHRASGQAVVTLSGQDFYLGPWRSKASHVEYDRLIGQWLANGRPSKTDKDPHWLTVVELMALYWKFVRQHYVKDGKPTTEQHCIRLALKPVKRLYGHVRADEFGPLAMKVVRQELVDAGNVRDSINRNVARIRRMFRWAASEELLPVTVYQALASLPGLQVGRSVATESTPVLPVDDATIDATFSHLQDVTADMVRFQRLTGCRPDEVCRVRPADVDTPSDVWIYRPGSHKTQHHGRDRTIFVGPKAQNVLRPYLLRDKSAYCFDPNDSERHRNANRRENRQSPMTPSQAARMPKRKPKRPIRERYDTNSYRRAIHRACDKAGIDRWSPNRLRHSAGTAIRRKFGLEAAQVILGHASADVTQVYAERDMSLAEKVAREVG